MSLRWERPQQGLSRGFSPEGHELAQVVHVHGPDGDELGWIAWLVHEQGELFDHFPTVDAARAAAEKALIEMEHATVDEEPS
jgi:hypothetical protein